MCKSSYSTSNKDKDLPSCLVSQAQVNQSFSTIYVADFPAIFLQSYFKKKKSVLRCGTRKFKHYKDSTFFGAHKTMCSFFGQPAGPPPKPATSDQQDHRLG